MLQTNSLEKDLDINKRIFRLIQIDEPGYSQGSNSQSLVIGSVINSNDHTVSHGSNNFTLANVGFNLPQKNMDQSLENEVVNKTDLENQDALGTLAATNIQIHEYLQTLISGQMKIDTSLQEIRDVSKNLNKNIENLITIVEALGGFLNKVIEVQNAVDLSLTMGFESVAAALQSRNLNNNIGDKRD